MEIRSYRRVFDLERRIYRVDRLRLNPGGVPVRGVLYFLAILSATLVAGRLPLLHVLGTAVPWYVRNLALPAASATVLTVIRIEGRTFHLAAHALVRYRQGPRWLVGVGRANAPGERWYPSEIVLLPDGSDSRMRRLRYVGPGAVLVATEHACAGRKLGGRSLCIGRCRRARVTLRELPGRRALRSAQVIALARGARLLVRSDTADEARR
jgi:hypothetical protein